MLPTHSSSAIILKNVKYGDSSLIVNVYTRNFGLMGLMARGIHKTNGKISSALLQPMNLVEIVFTENKKSNLCYLKEISLETPFHSISSNIYKSTILMFLNEILYKTLKEELPHQELFDYIKQSLVLLDTQQEQYFDFHLYFLAGLTKLLGILPNIRYHETWFDLSEGMTTSLQPNHNYYLEKESKTLFFNAFYDFQSCYAPMNINNRQRRELLDTFLLYYELHLPGLHDIKSKKVLHEILNN